MTRAESDDFSREFIGSGSTLILKCKSNNDNNYTEGEDYFGTAKYRLSNGMYTNYLVEGNDHTCVILTIAHLMDIFTIIKM